MYVPSPFPEPVSVIDSVASQKYDVRLLFTKQAMTGQFALMGVISILTLVIPHLPITTQNLWWIALGSVISLNMVRRLINGPIETVLSYLIFASLAVTLSQIGQRFMDWGYPAWILPVSAFLALSYAWLCGRDFSFAGCAFFTAFAAVGVTTILAFLGWVPWPDVGWAVVVALTYTGYITYDLAMMMKRRRPDELLTAVIDFYRDVLNFVFYPLRVWLHWKKYRFISPL